MPDLEKEKLIKQFFQNFSMALDGKIPHEGEKAYVTKELMMIDEDILEIIVNNQYQYSGGFTWEFNGLIELQKLRFLRQIICLLEKLNRSIDS